MRKERNAYANAIDRVREAHSATVATRNLVVECPRCRTRQELPDVPGMRRCVKCGFEFRPDIHKTPSA